MAKPQVRLTDKYGSGMFVHQIQLQTAPIGRGRLELDNDDDRLEKGWTVTVRFRNTRIQIQVLDSFDDGCYLGQVVDYEGNWEEDELEDGETVQLGCYLRFGEEHVFAVIRDR